MTEDREEVSLHQTEERPPSNDRAEQPLDPEALYSQGMAYYRRRRWREAKECFQQLHALQPSRRGIEALLNELEMFLRLESVESSANGQVFPDGAGAETAVAPEMRTTGHKRQGWWIGLVVLVIVIGTVGGVYLYAQGKLGILTPDRQVQSLRNQCQSYSVAQRHCRALEVCSELATAVPDDPEALNGVEKAKSKLYDEALAYVKTNAIPNALENLECIFAHDPNYKDVRVLIDNLLVRQEMDEQYQEAREYLDSRVYGEAINRLLKLRTMDPEYRPGTISDDLYEAYMGEGRQWLELVEGDLKTVAEADSSQPQFVITEELLTKVRQAIKSYERALGERPSSEDARSAQALAQDLEEGLQHYGARLWSQSANELSSIYIKDADYLSGKLAAILCDTRLHLGDVYFQQEEYEAALAEYQAMANMGVCDIELAQTKMQEAGLPLTPTATPTFTPTPTYTATPSSTPTPTNTPPPTATSTPTPTDTPTSPPPKPQHTSVPPTPKPTLDIPPR